MSIPNATLIFDSEHLTAEATFPEFGVTKLSAEDQAALGSLSSREIPAWIDARVQDCERGNSKFETYIATLHNSCAPISSLPDELLMKIFGEFSLNDPSIRRVCRRWRSVVLATPSFWAECLSSRPFGENLARYTFFCAALRYSGTQPLSLHLQYPISVTWRILLDHRGRIAELKLNRKAHFPSSDVENFFWSKPIESLRILKLGSTYCTSRELLALLENCRLLERLWLDTDVWQRPIGESDDSDVIECAISLPQLRELSISESPPYILQLLRLFKALPAQTVVQLFVTSSIGQQVLRPAFDFEGVFTPLPINRVCVEPFGELIVTKGYAGSDERLRLFSEGWEYTRALRSFAPPASVLTLNPRDAHDGGICETLTALWDLPHLCRLEITHTTPSKTKATSVARFLNRHRHRASELSLAWVLPIVPGQEEQSHAVAELRELSNVLKGHVDEGNPRMGRLELYAIVQDPGQEWKPFAGSIEAGSDARLCSQVVESFLADLRELADEVHIG